METNTCCPSRRVTHTANVKRQADARCQRHTDIVTTINANALVSPARCTRSLVTRVRVNMRRFLDGGAFAFAHRGLIPYEERMYQRTRSQRAESFRPRFVVRANDASNRSGIIHGSPPPTRPTHSSLLRYTARARARTHTSARATRRAPPAVRATMPAATLPVTSAASFTSFDPAIERYAGYRAFERLASNISAVGAPTNILPPPLRRRITGRACYRSDEAEHDERKFRIRETP